VAGKTQIAAGGMIYEVHATSQQRKDSATDAAGDASVLKHGATIGTIYEIPSTKEQKTTKTCTQQTLQAMSQSFTWTPSTHIEFD